MKVQYTMEELWGLKDYIKTPSNNSNTHTEYMAYKKYCLYVESGQYIAFSTDEEGNPYYMIVNKMNNADTFDSKEEAEEFNYKMECQATVVEWHKTNEDIEGSND